MKKLSSTLPNMIASLLGISMLSALLLGILYKVTKEPIEQQALQQQLDAIKRVAPEFDNNPEADSKNFTIDGNTFTVYPAMKNGKLVGAAVKGSSMNGFSGEIQIMAGFDSNGVVRDYQVLKHAETPGLGSKMEAWFRDPTGARSILDKSPVITSFYVTKDNGGEIDGITAATYSSRAFLEAVRNAYQAFVDYAAANGVSMNKSANSDASSGASKQNHATDNTNNADNVSDASSGASKQHKK